MGSRAQTAAAMTDRTNPPARMTVPARARGRGRPHAKATAGLRERAWWLARQLGKPFTLDDLLLTLNDSGAKDAASNLGRYLRGLELAGVLQRLQRRAPGCGPTSNGHVIWRLAMDLGPKAPVYRAADKAVWDPNAQRVLKIVAATSTTTEAAK